MLAEFASWWLARMAELAAFAQPGAALPDTLLVRPAGDGFVVQRRRRGRIAALGPLRPETRLARRRGESLTLAVDSIVLRRVVTLQLAAERGLATLLRYEMDRLTPFAAEDVVWDWRLLRRDRTASTLDAELRLLPRAAIAPLLENLAAAGLAVTAVEAPLAGAGPCHLPLNPPDPAAIARASRHLHAALALCGILVLACIATPLVRQSLALQALDDDIAATRPLVTEAQALQHRIAGDGTGADALKAGRAHAADALTALVALTDALPDDTWLSQLSLNAGRLTMEGQTNGAATRLIAAIAGQEKLRNPAFTAPVVSGDAGNELFALQAELTR